MHWQKHWKRFIQNTPLVSHPKVWWNPIPKLRHITCLNRNYFPSQSYYLFKPSYLLPQFKLDHFTPASIYACARPRGNNPSMIPFYSNLQCHNFQEINPLHQVWTISMIALIQSKIITLFWEEEKKWYMYHWFAFQCIVLSGMLAFAECVSLQSKSAT